MQTYNSLCFPVKNRNIFIHHWYQTSLDETELSLHFCPATLFNILRQELRNKTEAP